MRFSSAIGAFVVVLFLTGGSHSQSSPGAKQKAKADNLIVYGDDFAFSVKEPDTWHGDTGEAARKYEVNVTFFPLTKESREHDVSIRVRVNKKQDENTQGDLDYDMKQYKEQYPSAEFSDLKIVHPEYKTFGKLVFVPKQFYEYVAYLNPGSASRMNVSVAMSKVNEPASNDELSAFKTILQSLNWLGSPKIKTPDTKK